ncbi:DUF1214 domain-containing protein [Ruegeria marina]|uniref:Carboxylesterase n=1 Tax=Ruegeria marina TaxID=639004 RepID=A0A1G7F6M6_9RHOB|nr:DUF1214 domain-containing protein [Ruegeria marina]SDE71570.1 Protein of unknown function [Ruegeria marina]
MIALLMPSVAPAQDVTVENLIRAETDTMIRGSLAANGANVGELAHFRQPTIPGNQPVIRMNQDTLYSALVADLSEPLEITLPEVGGRYQSMHVINQDHDMFVEAEPGTYRLTEEDVGTRFASISFRTFVDVTDPDDIAAAHAAQDAIVVSGGSSGPFEAPEWDLEKLEVARKAVNDLATLGFEATYAFGRREDTQPVARLIGALSGWGGLPRTAASYVIASVPQNDGETPYTVTVADVPVDAFWSVTVYNSDGYLEANDLGVNSYNNVTAKPNEDGSFTLHFGGCDDERVNCIPITPGWNYAVRMYQPRTEILDGTWRFPSLEIAG